MIRGSKIDLCEAKHNIKANIHNRFDIEVVDAASGATKQRASALNCICSNLWSRMLSGNNYFNYIHYGGGAGTPSADDTSLFSFLGSKVVGNDGSDFDYSQGVFSLRRKIQLAAGDNVGVTLTEVGIGYSADQSSLCTHAMLQDMNGNQISITKSDTDVINIYATVFVHFGKTGYDNGSISVARHYSEENSILHWFAGMVMGGTIPNQLVLSKYGGLGLGYTRYGDYNYSGELLGLNRSHDVASKTITFTGARAEANAVNIGGVRSVQLWSKHSGTYSYWYPKLFASPGGQWFPHSQITGEAVGTGDGNTTNFALKFPFAREITVYVDGVEDPNVTLDYAPNDATAWHWYMEGLDEHSTVDELIPVHYSFNKARAGTYIFYNPMHAVGLASLRKRKNSTISVSDDLKAWTEIGASATYNVSAFAVPAEYAHSKFWKIVSEEASDSDNPLSGDMVPLGFTGKNLHFATPPAAGAVITADYKCDCIAKDEDHVFDFALTIHFSEYVE